MTHSLASILISSHNRVQLFRRCLWSIAYRPPPMPFEVVVADDGSDEDVLGVLREFSPCFPWRFIRVNVAEFETATGVKRYFNNPALTNNIAFRQARGELVFLMGNEIIATEGCFQQLVNTARSEQGQWLVLSTTYDLQQQWLDRLDRYGSNLTPHMIEQASRTPLHSNEYRSDVTNYLSLCPRSLWEAIGGYDERYVGGISADDSDFVRRARAAGARTSIAHAISLHQYHGGRTAYYLPDPKIITQERWDEGVRRNHVIYHAWDGRPDNPQSWAWGTFGVGEVIDNFTPRKIPPSVLTAVRESP